MKSTTITYKQIINDTKALAKKIHRGFDSIYAVPRGGVPVGILLSELLNLPMVEVPTKNTLIVDDLIDSGKTLEKFTQKKAVLYRKSHSPSVDYCVKEIDGWIDFAYEESKKDAEDLIVRLLEHVGENPNREGLKETPKRFLKFYKEFLTPTEFNFTVFDSEGYDEMIIQKDIPFFSLCEHHLAPFFGKATVAYIPNGKIVGLSKLTRTVELYTRRLQNQERITHQIAQRLEEELKPHGVAVTLEARHFCMEMRGVRTHDVSTRTTKLVGFFKDKPETRNEYMEAIR